MGWFLLFLVLIAIAFGVLSAVIKAVVFLVLTILFTIAALVGIAVLGMRHAGKRWQRDLERRFPSA